MLVCIAIAIAGLLMLSTDYSTYDTVDSARQKQGKFVHLIAKLDKSAPMEYDPANNPNYLSFIAVDSLGSKTKVVYRNTKPANWSIVKELFCRAKCRGMFLNAKTFC